MAYQVRITARALADANEVLARIGRIAPQAAARWHAALLDKVQTLEDHPERCPLAVEAEKLGIELRELLFGKRRGVYRILFTVDGDTVLVHHIRHAARDSLMPGEL